MIELKHCPFCGGEIKIYCAEKSSVHLFDHVERSDDCALLTPEVIHGARTYEEAAAKWNRRAES